MRNAALAQLETVDGQHAVIGAQQGSLLLNQGKALMDKCTTCGYRDTCGGGCVATRWRMDPADDHDAYCDYRMRMIDGIAALLAQPAHPAGAWCQSLRWRPRTPNSMRHVKAFLTRWGSPAAARGEVRLHTSEHGNINDSIAVPLEELRKAMSDLKLKTFYSALSYKFELPALAALASGWAGNVPVAAGSIAFAAATLRQATEEARDAQLQGSPVSYLLRVERHLKPTTLARRVSRTIGRAAGSGI